jgi:serine/threonine protein kinase/tetratricopeptide (TPR) repeat protein
MSTTDRPTMKNQAVPDEALGQMLGRYKLLEKIGEGGFGVVYVAEQKEPVKRRVALKIIKLGMDTRQVVARFEAERQALALMDHPNIAKVLDAGATDSGRPYFVMELVRGVKLTEYCDQHKLSTKQRLELFIPVCQAIQHAHQKGIIHRDIKPSNILVTLHDGVPVPKVIDFGIAKATQQDLTDKTVYTQLQQFVGTPAYMSPEQAEMSGLDVDTRSDIYSLGVLLYELLTGRTPLDPKELMSQGIDGMRKTIREKEPVHPSTKVATLQGEELTTTAARHAAEAPKLVSLLRGDLDWIVMKCLEKDRTRRYETANGLAADLRRHLNNEPISARPPSTAYRFQKALRRNKLLFAAGAAVVVVLILGVIGTSIGLVRAERQRRQAEMARKLAEQRFQSASQFVTDVLQRIAPEFGSLIGATEAQKALAQSSLSFLESLGGSNDGDETFQAELATLYINLSDTLGNPFAANIVGEYSNALHFATLGLGMEEQLLKKHPNDRHLLREVAFDRGFVGNILGAMGRSDEALVKNRQSLELLVQLLDQDPDNPDLQRWVLVEHWKIGNELLEQGQAQEALDQHYLPYAKARLERAVDPTLSSTEAHVSFVSHLHVGEAELKLGQPSKALPHFEAALRWTKVLVERKPNDARYARDWIEIHEEIGTAQIALGRFDEGLTNLQQAVYLAETLLARDPINGASQSALIGCLHAQASGLAAIARASQTSRSRQAELWPLAIQALSRCQEKLASAKLGQIWIRERTTGSEIAQELDEARTALAKLTVGSEPRPAKP